MQQRFASFIIRNEKLIPVFIFLLFLAASIPGVNWGVPALWNPDEMVWRVDSALRGEIIFDETEPDFNYPSLPKYVMFGDGQDCLWDGILPFRFLLFPRVCFLPCLGAVSGVLIYYLARTIGADVLTSALAGLLYIASGVAAANGRFAHNDLYLQFFSILCIYFAIKYQFTKSRLWIYGSFFAVGLAASSKYTGGSLLLVPLFVLILMNWGDPARNWLQSFEMLFIGGVLSFGGYIIGTPKALLWMAYYFKRVIPALQRLSAIWIIILELRLGCLVNGLCLKTAVGTFAYYLFILCFIWFAVKLILWRLGKLQMDEKQAQAIMILPPRCFIFDLPFHGVGQLHSALLHSLCAVPVHSWRVVRKGDH